MRAGTMSCLRMWSTSSTRPRSGSSGSRTPREPTTDAIPPIDHSFINVHDDGVDLVPVHCLGELQPCSAMGGTQGRVALVHRQLISEGIDVARFAQLAGHAML